LARPHEEQDDTMRTNVAGRYLAYDPGTPISTPLLEAFEDWGAQRDPIPLHEV